MGSEECSNTTNIRPSNFSIYSFLNAWIIHYIIKASKRWIFSCQHILSYWLIYIYFPLLWLFKSKKKKKKKKAFHERNIIQK